MILSAVVAVVITVHLRRKPIRLATKTLLLRGAKIEYAGSSIPWFHRLTDNYFANPIAIDMGHCRATNEDAESIALLRSTERLYLKHAKMSHHGVERIATLPKLKRLALWSCRSIGGDSAELLSKCRSLEVIDVHNTRINGADLRFFAELPRLQRLVFPARFTTPETQWLGSESLRALSESIPELVPVGKCYLYGVGDKDLHRFLDMDTSRVTRLQIRDGSFSDSVWRRLNQLKLGELDLQSCPVSDAQLATLDSEKIKVLELYFPENWQQTQVTASGLFGYLRHRVDEIRIFDGYAQFFDHQYSEFSHRLRISCDTELFPKEVLSQWIDSGVMEITVFRSDAKPILKALGDLNRSIRLTLIDKSQHWDQIRRMTSLDWLTLHTRGTLERPVGFTEQHQIRHLEMTALTQMTREDFRGIAKLKRLDWLVLRIRNPPQDELDELSELEQLEHVIINGKQVR